MWRFNAITGPITQIVLGFGIGGGLVSVPGGSSTLDFSQSASSGLILVLRRF